MRIDEIFEYHVAIFRDALHRALATEPAGSARHLRAYIRAACASMVSTGAHERAATARLMCDPACRVVWSEFIDEACGLDSIDPARQMACRYALEGFWLDCLLRTEPDPRRVGEVRDFLLAMAGT